MARKINRILEVLMPYLAPSSLIIGILIGEWLQQFIFLIPWIFAIMTFSGSLGLRFSQLKNVVWHPRPVLLAIFLLHILMPLWAWGIGHFLFTNVYIAIGYIIATIIPTGITSFVWVVIFKGNKPLCLAIILVDTLLSPLIVPWSLSLIVGEQVEIDTTALMLDLFFMIVLPSFIGMLWNDLSKGKVEKMIAPKLAPFSKIGIAIIVLINGGMISPYLKNFSLEILFIICCVFVLSCSGYLFSYLISKWLLKKDQEVMTLVFSGGMRNISSGAVIASSYFPAATVLPVVFGMLFQQILAFNFGKFAQRRLERQHQKHE
ncbi:bile acid:sodium symporter family protein [Bacillaceae bacterium Marseille-Q3522]|nr:bile acid:sodium symporter family protein [Bacillaceae bacterium Marseille-Q3522]